MPDLNNQELSIQIKKGLETNISDTLTLDNAVTGEPHFCTDTGNLYIYDGTNMLNVVATGSTGWTMSNVSSDKVLDADSTTLDELADVVGTLIDTLKAKGILGA